MESIRTFLENMTGKAGMADWPMFWRGVVVGIILWIVAYLLLGVIKWALGRSKKNRNICIAGDNGDLVITINAVEEFVRRILTEFHEASLASLGIHENKGMLVFNVTVEVVPDVDLVPLREAVQQRIIEEARQRLGIENPVRINVTVHSMEADGRKIQKADDKLARRTAKVSSPDVPQIESAENVIQAEQVEDDDKPFE